MPDYGRRLRRPVEERVSRNAPIANLQENMHMTNLKKFSTVATVAILYPTYILADLAIGDLLGKTNSEIRAGMESAGYAVKEVSFEDDEIEIEASINGQDHEIEVTPTDGMVERFNGRIEEVLQSDHFRSSDEGMAQTQASDVQETTVLPSGMGHL